MGRNITRRRLRRAAFGGFLCAVAIGAAGCSSEISRFVESPNSNPYAARASSRQPAAAPIAPTRSAAVESQPLPQAQSTNSPYAPQYAALQYEQPQYAPPAPQYAPPQPVPAYAPPAPQYVPPQSVPAYAPPAPQYAPPQSVTPYAPPAPRSANVRCGKLGANAAADATRLHHCIRRHVGPSRAQIPGQRERDRYCKRHRARNPAEGRDKADDPGQDAAAAGCPARQTATGCSGGGSNGAAPHVCACCGGTREAGVI